MDRRGVERVGALQLDLAAAFRAQLVGDHRKPGKPVQPILRPLGAERRDRAFNVGRGELGAGAREQRRRRADHRQRAAVEHVIFEPGLQFARIAQHYVVDGDRQFAAELYRGRVVVLQTLPDTGQVMHDRNAEPGQVLLRPNAGEHQQLRRVDGSAAQDDLARGAGGAEPAIPAKCHADGAAAFEQDFLGQGPGDDIEIGALHCRAEIADGGRAALAVARRRLVVADAVLAGAVEIVIAGKAELGRRSR